MNIQCQPASPIQPPSDMTAPDSGAPMTMEMALAIMNFAAAAARAFSGNHCSMYSRTPGTNPASASPSRKRSR